MKYRYAYDGLEEAMSFETGLMCDESEDKTVQSGKEDADINVLVRRFGLTGNLAKPNVEPFYGDFSEAIDYQSALNRVIEADHAFNAMPVEVRNRFENDPGKLWEFLHGEHTPETLAEGRKLGLFEPELEPAAPMKVEVVNPAPPPPAAPST